MRVLCSTLLGVALCASTACAFEANWHVGPDAPEAAGPSAAAPAAPTVTKAVMQTGSGAATTKFAVDTPEILCAWEVDGVAAGSEIRGAWVAVDTGGVVAPNYRIDEAKLTLEGPSSGEFNLTLQGSAWPKGRYQVEIYLDGKLAETVPFAIG